jgi:hypothetical protein
MQFSIPIWIPIAGHSISNNFFAVEPTFIPC